jgi:phosphoserine phosphatase
LSIIISDIEGTLTTGSSWRALRGYFKIHFNSWKYNLFFARWIPHFLLLKLKITSRRAAIFGWMQDEIRLFEGMSPAGFKKMAEWIVETEMWPKRRPEILAELDEYRLEGNQIVVISSAYQPIVQAFANRLNAIAIGTPVFYENSMLSGISLPINAYEYKAESVRGKFPGSDILAAYGDTASDIPMMLLSHSPVAVYPEDELRRMAELKGWRIIK